MSVALYVVLEQEIPGFNHSVNGKALGRAASVLDALAAEIGVQPLMEFFSASPEELVGFAESQGVNLKENATRWPTERWFPAEDGLKTVRALTQEIESKKVDQAERILSDLEEFRRVLEVAKENCVKWHLAVDF